MRGEERGPTAFELGRIRYRLGAHADRSNGARPSGEMNPECSRDLNGWDTHGCHVDAEQQNAVDASFMSAGIT